MFALINTVDIYSQWWARKIKRFIEQYRIEALHVHDLYMAKAGHLATKSGNIKLVLDLHENYPSAVMAYQWMNKFPTKLIIRPWAWKKKEKDFLRYPDKIIVLSDYFKSQLLKKYSFLKEGQIVVYPNIPNTEELLSYPIDEKIIEKQSTYIMFYFGGVSKRRGIFVVIEALKILVKEIPDMRLLIVGPVDKAEAADFQKAITSEGVEDYIIYFPWKDISILPSLICVSDICLSPIEKNPQHESGIANKIYQYMLFERPLLVSNCKPQADLVETVKCGLVHEWDSVEDFIDKVRIFYNNKKEAVQMGLNGRKAILAKYNHAKVGLSLLEAYEKTD